MKTLNVILTHIDCEGVASVVAGWRSVLGPDAAILVAYGGSRGGFDQVAHADKVFVDGERHKTRDHQREKQSYCAVWRAVAEMDGFDDYDFINFAEGDVVPLVPDWTERLRRQAEEDNADVLCHGLHRVDGTSNPHFLHHASEARFNDLWKLISVREDTGVVLAMLGAHSFWKREAFSAVALFEEPFPIYLEIYLPTVAHHLGYRVRNVEGQSEYISPFGNLGGRREELAAAGAWAIHPVKEP